MYHYITNEYFLKDLFIEGLKKIEVEAYATDKGVMLDREKLLKTKASTMPWIVKQNIKFIEIGR